MAKQSKPTFDKDLFIKTLSSMTPEDMNKTIEMKGKKTKGVPLIVRIEK